MDNSTTSRRFEICVDESINNAKTAEHTVMDRLLTELCNVHEQSKLRNKLFILSDRRRRVNELLDLDLLQMQREDVIEQLNNMIDNEYISCNCIQVSTLKDLDTQIQHILTEMQSIIRKGSIRDRAFQKVQLQYNKLKVGVEQLDNQQSEPMISNLLFSNVLHLSQYIVNKLASFIICGDTSIYQALLDLKQYHIKAVDEIQNTIEKRQTRVEELYKFIYEQPHKNAHYFVWKKSNTRSDQSDLTQTESFVKFYPITQLESIYEHWIMQQLFGEHGTEVEITYLTKNTVQVCEKNIVADRNITNIDAIAANDGYKQLFNIMIKSLIIGAINICEGSIVGNKVIDCNWVLDTQPGLYNDPFITDVIGSLFGVLQQLYNFPREHSKEMSMIDPVISTEEYNKYMSFLDALRGDNSVASKIIQMFMYSQCIAEKDNGQKKAYITNYRTFALYSKLNVEKMLEFVKNKKLDTPEYIASISQNIIGQRAALDTKWNIDGDNNSTPYRVFDQVIERFKHYVNDHITQLTDILPTSQMIASVPIVPPNTPVNQSINNIHEDNTTISDDIGVVQWDFSKLLPIVVKPQNYSNTTEQDYDVVDTDDPRPIMVPTAAVAIDPEAFEVNIPPSVVNIPPIEVDMPPRLPTPDSLCYMEQSESIHNQQNASANAVLNDAHSLRGRHSSDIVETNADAKSKQKRRRSSIVSSIQKTSCCSII